MQNVCTDEIIEYSERGVVCQVFQHPTHTSYKWWLSYSDEHWTYI